MKWNTDLKWFELIGLWVIVIAVVGMLVSGVVTLCKAFEAVAPYIR